MSGDERDVPDGLRPLFDAALPEDAPGAWIREAILSMATRGGHSQ